MTVLRASLPQAPHFLGMFGACHMGRNIV